MTRSETPSPFANDDAYCLYRSGETRPNNGITSSPILLSVPHAGRDYPAHILRNSRLPQNALQKLEDRFADLLVTKALAAGYEGIVAQAPRAWIDLNREPVDLDLQYICDMPFDLKKRYLAAQNAAPEKMKANAGLGLIPSRLSGYGDIWRSSWQWADVERRIAHTHKAYHDALADHLKKRYHRHGCAVLLDIHSMPSLPKSHRAVHNAFGKPVHNGIGNTMPQIILGNRHGKSADQDLLMALERIAKAYGLNVGHNHPYAGGYVLNRHSDTQNNVQAVQIEFDRALYLDPHGEPTAGIEQMQSLLLDMANLAHNYAATYLEIKAAE